MVKVFNRYLPLRVFIFAGIDALCLFSVTALCLFAATDWETIRSGNGSLFIVVTGGLCLATMYFFDLYDLDRIRHGNDVIIASMRAMGVGALILAPVSILFLHLGVRAHYLEAGMVTTLILICLYRVSYDYFFTRINRGERILLIGNGPIIDLLARRIRGHSYLPLQIVAIMSSSQKDDASYKSTGRNMELDALIASFQPERIAIDRSPQEHTVSVAHLIELRQQGIRIDDAYALYEAVTARVPVEMLQTPSLAYGPGFSFTPWNAATHRILDFILASILFLLTWPIFLIVAICIHLDSKGPTFYKQERVGLHNRCFNVIKFRSMRNDAESKSGPVWAQQKDSRVTRCGRVIRKLRLDELPQIWNVLRGDMSLVGPRPERPHFVNMLRQDIPFYDLRHSVRPGITGWAQVCAPYGASVAESLEKVEYDLFYLKNKSTLFDLFILLRTAKVCLLGRGAR